MDGLREAVDRTDACCVSTSSVGWAARPTPLFRYFASNAYSSASEMQFELLTPALYVYERTMSSNSDVAEQGVVPMRKGQSRGSHDHDLILIFLSQLV